jgi:hypothetical protein
MIAGFRPFLREIRGDIREMLAARDIQLKESSSCFAR